MNLVPDKAKAYSEVFRVLKPGGHFSISDVVLEGALPKTLMNVAEMYAGCISGAIQKDVYLKAIHDAGFKNVTIQKQKAILLPDDILKEYLSESDIKTYKESGVGIFSITVYGEKEKKDQPCCPPGCCN